MNFRTKFSDELTLLINELAAQLETTLKELRRFL
jgi:hypothetical protein